MALPEPGSVFADKYLIESQLGRGSVGVVLGAMHLELRQPVAIKLLQSANSTAGERLVREARAALSLHSEHVVRVMDVGRDQGRVYVVMEQLAGADLKSVLDARGRFSVPEAVDYALHACAGVSEAHARGIIHRDLKPSNLFLTTRADRSPLVKVLDFGISKFSESADPEGSLTGSAEMLGSPMYMSPEQVRGAKSVDHRTDIWSLGVTLYRFLTGTAPFGGSGASASAALAAVVSDDPRPMNELVPDLPRALAAVVMRCLSKSPADRYGSIAELAGALGPFGTDEGRSTVARLVRGLPPGGAIPLPAPETRGRPPWGRRGATLAASIVVVLSMGAVALGLSRRSHPAPASVLVPAAPPSPIEVVALPSPVAPAATPADVAAIADAPPPPPAPRSSGRPVARPRDASPSRAAKSAAINDRY
jgi:serine/threonine-protein kinase